jgi:hypothetical protein
VRSPAYAGFQDKESDKASTGGGIKETDLHLVTSRF